MSAQRATTPMRGGAPGAAARPIAWSRSASGCTALRVPVGTPLLRLSRISRDVEGRIFEASQDRYLGDVVRFTVSGSGISADGQYLRAVGG
ncbi:UTRA domain-containing protein [Microbacterium sp. NPDC089321]|uniref:UTRA domain-containing protein n=1 Tax=Microbacterium sp. NPDC089321 TaxID=3155183 RepID=UPI0034275C75